VTLSRAPLLSVFALLAASSASALDPSKQVSQYGHTAWRTQDGYLGGSPSAIAQTRDGDLWVATQAGLTRFDGVRFAPWAPPVGQKLPSPQVYSLLAARNGGLWIGAEGHLGHWMDGHFTIYSIGPFFILSILEAHDGTIWFVGAGRGRPGVLCRVQGAKVACHGPSDGIEDSSLSALAEDDLGNLWIGGDTAVVRWTPASHDTYKLPGLQATAYMGGVSSLVPARDGSLWVGMEVPGRGLGVQRLVDGAWKRLAATGLDGSTLSVRGLYVDRGGDLWIGTLNEGLYRIHGETLSRFRSTDGLSSDFVFGFHEDREGTLWVVTAKGVDSFRDLGVVTVSTREGLSGDEVDGVLASRDGTVWVGGVDTLDGIRDGVVSSMRTGKDLPRGTQITSVFEDRAGRLWVGIDNTLSVSSDGHFKRIDMPGGGPMGMVVGLTESTDGSVWAEIRGTPWKLVRIQDGHVREVLPEPGIPAARRVAADPQGGIWLGLASGDLARLRNGALESFSIGQGRNLAHDAFPIRQLHVNGDGAVLGAATFGLIGWHEGTKRILTVRNGLPCDRILALVEDGRGDLWLGSQCGLVKIAREELREWWNDPDVQVHPMVLDVFDGWLPGDSPFQPAARSPDGRLWFANAVVLQMVDPDHLPRNTRPPPVHIEDVVADRRSYPPSAGLRLPPLTRDLQISYSAASFVVPQKVRFRYKLEGHDTNWVEPGTRRQAFYNDLGPGDYRFRVIACNNDGVWNEEGAALSFSVVPAWYQTSAFRALSVVLVVFMVWALYRLRVQQIEAAIGARFDERLAERTRLARDIHDTLLQTLQGSKLVADDALDASSDAVRMRGALGQLSGWLARATQEVRAALDCLRMSTTEGNDLMEALTRATESEAIPGSMTVTGSVVGDPREMHPIVRDEVYRIGYEAILNAGMHSKASRLTVELEYAQNLALRVTDDGLGIDPAVADQGKPGHFGLQGMRERAVRIEGKLTIASAGTSGTTINLVVPGGIAFRKARATPLRRMRLLLKLRGRAPRDVERLG